MYWIVRAKWNGIDEFLENNIWQNGYDDMYQDVIKKGILSFYQMVLILNTIIIDAWKKFEIPAKGNDIFKEYKVI